MGRKHINAYLKLLPFPFPREWKADILYISFIPSSSLSLFWIGLYILSDIQHVQMVTFDWWEVKLSWRGEWRSVLVRYGGQCVMTSGKVLMPLWSVDSLDLAQVSLSLGEFVCRSVQWLWLLVPEQVQRHFKGLHLARELIPSTLTMLCVLGQSPA